ncbi:MAG: type transport system permease protein [Solirubrobacterales bacterium]|nr:type transport system permease protein [Solirubrobacterales bacterium]
MNLMRSEWIKLFTTRTTWVMLGIGLLCEGLFAGLYVGLTSLANIVGEDGEGFEEVLTGLGLLMTLMLVLGVLVITTEFRHGTTGSTFLVTPKRWPVMVAKLGACVLIGLLAGLLFVLVNGGLALGLFDGRGGTLPPTSRIAEIYAGVIASFALLAAFGLGIGAIVRNQVGAIIAAIAVFFVISGLPELLPGTIGEYFPAQAVGTLHGRVEGEGTLTQVGAGFILAAWSFALVAVGTALTVRRDLSE